MQVGDYVRTTKGEIGKIIDYVQDPTDYYFNCYVTTLKNFTDKYITEYDNYVKVKENIIDLIEVGDYINGHKVIEVNNKDNELYNKYIVVEFCDFGNEYVCYSNNEIKSIVTKETFESMEYIIEE